MRTVEEWRSPRLWTGSEIPVTADFLEPNYYNKGRAAFSCGTGVDAHQASIKIAILLFFLMT